MSKQLPNKDMEEKINLINHRIGQMDRFMIELAHLTGQHEIAELFTKWHNEMIEREDRQYDE